MALGRSDGLLYAEGQGYSHLDAAAARDRLDGFAVVDGLAVTVDSGLTLSIASGTATVGSASNSVDTVSLGSSTTTTLQSADSTDPRKDTVYIDTNGDVQVETGTADPYEPAGDTLFDTYVPEPPEPSTEGVILAEVVVPAGASSINTSDHVRDRRQPAQAVVDQLDARGVATDSATHNDDYTDPGGVKHTGELADLADLFSPAFNVNYPYPIQWMKKTSGGGSVTFPDEDTSIRVIQLREPGNASAVSEARVFDDRIEVDPTVAGAVEVFLTNITIDDSSTARILVGITDEPDSSGLGSDGLWARADGDDDVLALALNDGSQSFTNKSQSAGYTDGLQRIKVAWDGSTVTATFDDGSTEVTASVSNNYPSGENLFLKIAAVDGSGSNSNNSDFDVDGIQVET